VTATQILITIILYFAVLITISYLVGRKGDSATFFRGNRSSPWYVVAFGMIGASLSGVTFISVPGAVEAGAMNYFQVVLGYVIGYAVIGMVLLPLYYRLNLTSIYTYLDNRYGNAAQYTGSSFFILSRIVGASFRLYLVAGVLQEFVFKAMGISFWQTVTITVVLIWLYTFKSGIKTIVWTDTLQTLFMLIAVGVAIYYVSDQLELEGGVLLTAYASSNGIDAHKDALFPSIALDAGLGIGIGLVFILGLVAAAYSSADSALTSLTTSFSVDIVKIEKNYNEKQQNRLRKLIHVGFSIVLILVIIGFEYLVKDDSVINKLFEFSGYTYGPLLGLFAFGILTKLKVHHIATPIIAILSPFIAFTISHYAFSLYEFEFGFFILLLNGGITFLGLFIASFLSNDLQLAKPFPQP